MNLTGYSYGETSLLMQLDCIVENLRDVFERLQGQEYSTVEAEHLEGQKDRYFSDLNELLPQLASFNHLYGNAINERLSRIPMVR